MEDRRGGDIGRWLGAFALAYGLLHHAGVVLARLGETSLAGTRWGDWLDLAIPPVVLSTAAGVLWQAGARRSQWVLFGVGAVLYAEGHGIHLAANSIGNVEPGHTAHLWDEVVGHYVWYSGVGVVIAALAWTGSALRPLRGIGPLALALVVGATYATNALEGGTAVLALGSSAAFTLWGLAGRASAAHLLVPAFALAFSIVAAYGVWHGGFPQPSSIGWGPF